MDNHLNLCGLWEFAYRADRSFDLTHLPSDPEFCTEMPIPGYWDDHIDRLKTTSVWSRDVRFNPGYRMIEYPLGTGKPFDTSLPFLLGNGWYRRRIQIPADWENHVVLLRIAGAKMDLAVWINGKPVILHQNHLVGLCLPIQDMLFPGQTNELILGVSNLRQNLIGCETRGYKGFSAGIYGPVSIEVSPHYAITDLYVYPDSDLSTLHMEVEGTGLESSSLRFHWKIQESPDSSPILQGIAEAARFSCSARDLTPWSEQNPILYYLEIQAYLGNTPCGKYAQRFGLRRMQTQGQAILLNGIPTLLRGLTEHGYFPLTCTPPMDKVYYRRAVRRYQEIGFNWIRFHTTVPHEAYLEACDELGMLVQVEAPNGFDETLWEQILRRCRRHPSVILYCCGNEVPLTDPLLDQLERCRLLQQRLVPDALFSPMEALPGADWMPDGSDLSDEPLPHNPQKMSRLRAMSDVLEPQKHIGIDRPETRWQDLEPLVAFYGKPYLSHEVGILDTYLSLDLEKRYEGTRIGTSLFSGARALLQAAGLLDSAPLYYRHSCYWSAVLRKLFIERLRLTRGVSGYDYLGAIDCHWHRCGYTPGILNEFHEYKPGENASQILRYNDESLLLTDLGIHRNYRCGEDISFSVFSSVYGIHTEGPAVLEMRLTGSHQNLYWYASRDISRVPLYEKILLQEVTLTTPTLPQPDSCHLKLTLTGPDYVLENEYSLWLFPSVKPSLQDVRVFHHADSDPIPFLQSGGRALILSPLKMSRQPLHFYKLLAGRPVGTTATVLHDHPIWQGFPQEGWCDLQFYPMMESACSVVFDEHLPLPFHPILETVHSYKFIRKQAAIFEFSVGTGRALVCTLCLSGTDPAQEYLLAQTLNYMRSSAFYPVDRLTPEEAMQSLLAGQSHTDTEDPDTGLDGNAVLGRWDLILD